MKIKSIIKYTFLTAKISVLAFFALSCVTSTFSFNDIDVAVGQNDYPAAIEAIEKSLGSYKSYYDEKNEISLYLDKGLLKHYGSNYEESLEDLQKAEKLMEETYLRRNMEDIFSYIQNDNDREYPGEDYEDIYLNIFNALNYYSTGNTKNALAELQKIIKPEGKLVLLSKKYDYKDPKTRLSLVDFSRRETGINKMPLTRPVNFSNSALARYLGALFYRAEGNTNAARDEFEQINRAFSLQRNIYKNPIPQTVQQSLNIPAGRARLDIIGFTGLSPMKEETTEIQYLPFQHPVLQIASFKVPGLVKRPSLITGIEVVINEKEKINLELLEDMGAVIEEIFSARYSNILLRIYIRTIIKYAIADIAAMAANQNDDLSGLLIALAARAQMEASDKADIRMSRFLPDKAYIGGINLSPGTHKVLINYYSGFSVIASEHKEITVNAGALNLLHTVNLK